MDRLRRLFPAVALAFLVVTTGCLGAIVGDEPLSFTATEATIGSNAVSDAGYTHEQTQKLHLNRTVEAGDQKRRVEVTNWLSVYTKSAEIESVGEQKVSAVAVLSSPEVNVLGQSFNPIAQLSNKDLVERIISEGGSLTSEGNVRDVQKVDSSTVTILGEETEVTKFSAVLTVDGQEIDGYVHVAKVTHDGDVVLVAGMYPKQLSTEEANVFSMMEDVEH